MANTVAGSISFSRYVNITSGVGAATQIGNRSLGACVISTNTLIPSGTLINFNSAADVGVYFGTSSDEYKRALFYFSFVNKDIQQPDTLSFWFWNNDAATGSLIFGTVATYAVSQFTGTTTGDFTLTLGGHTGHITGIDLSGAGSLAAVAADIQTAIRAVMAGGAPWTSATVSYDATNARFDLVSGSTGADTITVVAGVVEDVASLLGWLPPTAILSNGTSAQTLTANLTLLNTTNNNFGSFCLGTSAIITEANIQAAAAWNYALTPNIQYLFCWVASAANFATWQATISGVGGHAGTVQSTGEYPEMLPMAVFDSTNYAGQNTVQNYMFQQANLTPSVTSDSVANTLDAALANYYGQTQVNGQYIAFYQRGVMSGGQPTDPALINLYVNEIWLKSAMADSILNLLLALANLSANNTGKSQLLAIVQSIINQALFNGTISVGNLLTEAQIIYITNATGSNTAWQQVQNIGYWINVVFEEVVISNVTQYKARYTLIYAKDNVINLIDGKNILI